METGRMIAGRLTVARLYPPHRAQETIAGPTRPHREPPKAPGIEGEWIGRIPEPAAGSVRAA